MLHAVHLHEQRETNQPCSACNTSRQLDGSASCYHLHLVLLAHADCGRVDPRADLIGTVVRGGRDESTQRRRWWSR